MTSTLSPLDNSTFDPTRCVVHDLPISITSSWYTKRTAIARVVENVLTPEECALWIAQSEQTGYEEALINIGGGKQMKVLDARKSSRCIVDDSDRVSELWTRIRPFVPEMVIEKKVPYELNERLRFLRYDVGEYFAPHMDGRYDRPLGHPRYGDHSMVTFQLYLNDDFEGGTTRFFHSTTDEQYDVVPKMGSVLLFEHRMEHSGETVSSGRKYAIRTDVMYTNADPSLTVEAQQQQGNTLDGKKSATSNDNCVIS